MKVVPDIPRIYTALAEWCACMVYISAFQQRFRPGTFWPISAAALMIQTLFLYATGEIPVVFWILCMMAAAWLMFCFLFLCGKNTVANTAYYCVQAFALAELAASLEWQLHCFFQIEKLLSLSGVALLVFVYGLVFSFMKWLVSNQKFSGPKSQNQLLITVKEVYTILAIEILVFLVSNISFVSIVTPFSGRHRIDIQNIRTLVALGGVAILFAHFLQCENKRVNQELEAIRNVMENQYIQYQQSKETIDLINRKYHDMKHQIQLVRGESNENRRNLYLNQMEEEIKKYEARYRTGNPALDTVITGKSLYCLHHDITLTFVADGKLLDFMDVMDLCAITGNALDNAIEYEEKVADARKRLIHMSVSEQKGFVLLKVENYCDDHLVFKNDLPVTTKGDLNFHGYGLKSIRYVAEKYGGTAAVKLCNHTFELNVLIPVQ